jgi:hypothetical protein
MHKGEAELGENMEKKLSLKKSSKSEGFLVKKKKKKYPG